jgi:hypothetical protein
VAQTVPNRQPGWSARSCPRSSFMARDYSTTVE